MQIRRATLFMALTSLVTVALAGCASVGGEIEVAAPEWKSGYAWSYAYTEEFEGFYEENGEGDNYTDSEPGRYTNQVVNTTMKAGDEPVYVLLSQYEGRNAGIRVLSQDDLSRKSFGYGWSRSCVNGQCNGDVDLYLREDDEEDKIWPKYLDFPLKTGKSWGAIVDLSEFDEDDLSISVIAGVEGAAVADLPVGPTTAAKVVFIISPANPMELESMIRAEGEEEGYQVDALDIFYETRETLYFSAEYQNIVQRQVVDTERFYARGSDPDGEPFEFRSEATYTYSEVLDGARLTPGPELAIDEFLPYFAGDRDLIDPNGEGIIAADYTLDVSPARLVVNAGESETASFKANIVGADAIPEEHALSWKLYNAAGKVVKTGDGDQFDVTVSQPGRYAVAVEARQGDDFVTSDGATLTANWIGTTRLSCPVASALGVPSCDAGSVPAFPGIKSLVVRAEPTGQLGATPASSMTVRDALGQSIAGRPDGDGYKVEVTNFDGYYLDRDGWRMDFRHGAGVSSDVDMYVEAIYATSGDPTMTAQATVVPERSMLVEGLARPW